MEPSTLLVTLLVSVLGAVIGMQVLVTLGITPNTALIGVLLAVALSRAPVPALRRFRSVHRQHLLQTSAPGRGAQRDVRPARDDGRGRVVALTQAIVLVVARGRAPERSGRGGARSVRRPVHAAPPVSSAYAFLSASTYASTGSRAIVGVKTSIDDQAITDPTSYLGAPRLRVAPRTLRLGLRIE
jgi:hypothetical protein